MDLIIIAGLILGGLILGGLLFLGAFAVFRRGFAPPPEDNEPSSDLSEYKRFMSERPTVAEMRQSAPLDFDKTVDEIRNHKEV